MKGRLLASVIGFALFAIPRPSDAQSTGRTHIPPDFGALSIGLSLERTALGIGDDLLAGFGLGVGVDKPVASDMVLRTHYAFSRWTPPGTAHRSGERRLGAGIARAFLSPRNPRADVFAELGVATHRFSYRAEWKGSLYGGGGTHVPLPWRSLGGSVRRHACISCTTRRW
jgi:opacity protein-like surface antigen